MSDKILASTFNNWWDTLTTIETKLSATKSTQQEASIGNTAEDTTINAFINALNAIQSNKYGQWADWTNKQTTVSRGTLIENNLKTGLNSLLDILNNNICANDVSKEGGTQAQFTTAFSVKGVSSSNVSTCNTCSNTVFSQSGFGFNQSTSGDSRDNLGGSFYFSPTTTFGTDNSGCSTGTQLAFGQNGNYGFGHEVCSFWNTGFTPTVSFGTFTTFSQSGNIFATSTTTTKWSGFSVQI